MGVGRNRSTNFIPGHLYSIRIPSLKLVCLPIPKIWLIFSHGVNRPGELTFDLLILKLVRNVSRGTDNLPANFGVSVTFRRRVMGKHGSNGQCDYNLDLCSFDL